MDSKILISWRRGEGLTSGDIEKTLIASCPKSIERLWSCYEHEDLLKITYGWIHLILRENVHLRMYRALAVALNIDIGEPWNGEAKPADNRTSLSARRKDNFKRLGFTSKDDMTRQGEAPAFKDLWDHINEPSARVPPEILSRFDKSDTSDSDGEESDDRRHESIDNRTWSLLTKASIVVGLVVGIATAVLFLYSAWPSRETSAAPLSTTNRNQNEFALTYSPVLVAAEGQQLNDLGGLLGDRLGNQLAQALAGDGKDPVVQPDGLTPLPGLSIPDQRRWAESAASRHDLDLVLVPELVRPEGGEPALRVSMLVSERSVAETPELIGYYPHILAVPITEEAFEAQRGPDVDEALAQATDLGQALGDFIVGLRHYERGGTEYGDARQAWEAAATSPVWQSAGASWLLDLMRGNLELRSGDYDAAESFYNASLAGVAGGDDSMRPAVGLAEADYLKAFQPAESSEIQTCRSDLRDEYGRIESDLTTVIEADRANDLASVRKKALFTRARIRYCYGLLDGAWEAARTDAEELTDSVTSDRSTVDRRLGAYGYVLLAQISLDERSDRAEALRLLRRAEELAPTSQADVQEVVYVFLFEFAAAECDEALLIEAQDQLARLGASRSWPSDCGSQPSS